MEKQKPHILIVDDSTLDRSVISTFLTQAGFAFSEAVNGESVINLLEKNAPSFDLILLDRMMPGMSGIDVLHKLYSMACTADIPVIIITSQAERTDQKNAYTYGAFDFIFKPVDETLLIHVIRRALLKRAELKNNKK